MLRCIYWEIVTDVSREHSHSIFRVEFKMYLHHLTHKVKELQIVGTSIYRVRQKKVYTHFNERKLYVV